MLDVEEDLQRRPKAQDLKLPPQLYISKKSPHTRARTHTRERERERERERGRGKDASSVRGWAELGRAG